MFDFCCEQRHHPISQTLMAAPHRRARGRSAAGSLGTMHRMNLNLQIIEQHQLK